MPNLLIENGKITLPEDLVHRYHLDEHTPIRVIETRTGILLVPLTDAPMTDALRSELEDWQALGAESLDVTSEGQAVP